MELTKFLKLLYKQRYILIAVPIIAIILTFYLVHKLPDTYSSMGRIQTGLLDQSEQQLINTNPLDNGESKINQEFNNLIQSMQLKKIYDKISYLLIIHDLTSTTPFRIPSREVKYLSAAQKKQAVEFYTKKYNSGEELSLWKPNEKGLDELMLSMGYDDKDLMKKIVIYRVNNSDYIDVEFESDSPFLSAFVVNALCNEFINYHTSLMRGNQVKAIAFLDSVLKQKENMMNERMQELKNYKITNRILNLNEQAKILYTQMADFDTRKQATEKDIQAYEGALKGIDDKFNPKDRKYLESTVVKINQEIIATKEILKQASQDYIKSNYDVKYKNKIDSLQTVLTAQINQSTDKYILNPLAAKESLVQQKINLEIQLDLAKNSINALNAELEMLNQRFDKLVPHEAVVQSYESEIDIASKEYIEILRKFNQTTMESSFSSNLRQIEMAAPGQAQPSKKMLIVALSGLLSFIFCMMVMFIIFYLDNSIETPKELADKTHIPVLGSLPFLNESVIDLAQIWHTETDKGSDIKKIEFKDAIRSLRFEVEKEMAGRKIIQITSFKPEEGKTMVAMGLAYAFAANKKKVLLLDLNYQYPVISSITQTKVFFRDVLSGKISLTQTGNQIDVIGTYGGDVSIFEMGYDTKIMIEKMAKLAEEYDIIIVEISSFAFMNNVKESNIYAEAVLAVFEANQTITEEIKEKIKYLKSLNSKFIGWAMNKEIIEAKTKRTKSEGFAKIKL